MPETAENLDTGQSPESQAGTGQSSDPPTDKEGKDKETPLSGEGKEKGEKDKLPYDQDPKWKKARAAEKFLDNLVDKHGFKDYDDLLKHVERGSSLEELIGSADAKTLVDKARTLDRYMDQLAEKERQEKLKDETPDETIARLEDELKSEKRQNEKTIKSQEEQQVNQKAIDTYNKEVKSIVSEIEDLPEDVHDIAALFLGVDNPMDDIDIKDIRTVRATARKSLKKFAAFLDSYKKSVIDDYVAKKEGISATPSSEQNAGPSGESAEEKLKLDEKDTIDSAFAKGQMKLLALLRKKD